MADDRRQQIMGLLRASADPITGSELARRLGVSRQIIVQDVALLRAAGEQIIATPQGYILYAKTPPTATTAVLACQHTREQTEDELNTLVDLGIKVVDVIVEHPIYGELRGILMLQSRADTREFVRRLEETGAELLSALTKGVHLHTVEASKAAAIEKARTALARKGYLLSESSP